MKSKLLFLPESLLLVLSVFWFFEAYFYDGFVNFLALFFASILLFQLFYKNKIIGFALAILLLILSLYLVLAVVAEYNEFPTQSKDALTLLIVGLILSVVLLVLGVALFYKYLKLKAN